MTQKQLVTLVGVIKKFKSIADEQYEGKMYDHVLTIFNKLTIKEKRVLLKGLINICFITEDRILVDMDNLDELRKDIKKAVVDVEYTHKKVKETSEHNNKEIAQQLIAFKILLLKAFIVTLIFIVIIVAIFTIQINQENNVLSSFVEGAFKMISIIIG